MVRPWDIWKVLQGDGVESESNHQQTGFHEDRVGRSRGLIETKYALEIL